MVVYLSKILFILLLTFNGYVFSQTNNALDSINLSDGVSQKEAILMANNECNTDGFSAKEVELDGKVVWECIKIPMHYGRAMVKPGFLYVIIDKSSGEVIRKFQGPNRSYSDEELGIPSINKSKK